MLIQDELNYDLSSLEFEHQQLHSQLNVEQKNVYDIFMNVVNNKKGGAFSSMTLHAAIRSKCKVVINVASSGIAALLLSGGRIVHSRFHIPINLNENSFCYITPGNDVVALLNKASLIIWDEAQ
uniref:ATP-dependent DNA helicase n=1 Tax=Lactuca sativa TaxID=4236 RepID=A0A9R1WTZ0_LACSA|nr:hypothetical protein LSAT_V11C100019460 [Lactuca sativa]